MVEIRVGGVMETTCLIRHFDDFGQAVPITGRHEAIGVQDDGFTAVVLAELPPFVGALTNETELSQLNVLAITRDAGLGDVLMTMPIMLKLSAEFPKLWTHFYVPDWTLGVMEWAAQEQKTLDVHPMRNYDGDRYVKTVNLSWYVERQPPDLQASVDRVALFARAFGVELAEREKRWRLRTPSECTIELRTHEGPTVALGLESAAPHRAPTPGLACRIGRAVLARGAQLVLLGKAPPSPDVCARLCQNGDATEIVAGQDLTNVASMIEWQTDCLVCGDTGLYHLAGVVETPFVALFGAIPPATRLMGYKRYAYFTARDKLPCIPCLESPKHWACQPLAPCMDILDAEAIADKAMILAERQWKQRQSQTTQQS